MPFLTRIALITALGMTALSAGETLYNGIVLPSPWPPQRTFEAIKAGEVMEVPYLKSPPAVIPINLGRQLFVDDFLIESTTLNRIFHAATMHPGNPVVKPDKGWEMEGRGPMAMVFSDGVWFDPKDQLFKMWYMASYGSFTALATSRDGLTWEKPDLNPRRGGNVVHREVRDSSTVWLDHEEKDPQRRFKLFRSHSEDSRYGLSLYFSADGIHWQPRALRTGSAGDRTTVFWNPFRQVWVYSLRHGWGQPRARRYWETRDLITGPQWEKIDQPPIWLGADRLDPPREDAQKPPQLYNLDAVAYESLMVGLFTIWRGDADLPKGRPKPNSVWLGYSRDGFHWDRPDRRPLLSPSEKRGDWNWGNVQSAGGCFLVVGDKLWIYFSGRSGTEKNKDAGGATGLAFLRRDGFASMNAGAEGGTLTTRPLTFSGSHLFVNVAIKKGGSLRAELLDREGTVIEPFTEEACIPVREQDSTRLSLRWRGDPDLSKLAGRPIRLRFHLNDGALYSFWLSPDPNGASQGYVAAGGPGFNGVKDATPAK